MLNTPFSRTSSFTAAVKTERDSAFIPAFFHAALGQSSSLLWFVGHFLCFILIYMRKMKGEKTMMEGKRLQAKTNLAHSMKMLSNL